MNDLIFSVIAFFIIYICYVLFVITRKKKLEKFKNNSYVTFLVTKYGVDLNKTSLKTLAHAIALTNSFIISATLFIISYASNIAIMLILAFIIIMPFQLVMYHVIGKLFGSKK